MGGPGRPAALDPADGPRAACLTCSSGRCKRCRCSSGGADALDERTVGTAFLSALQADDRIRSGAAGRRRPAVPRCGQRLRRRLRPAPAGRTAPRAAARDRPRRRPAAAGGERPAGRSIDGDRRRAVDSWGPCSRCCRLAAVSGWPGRCCCGFTRPPAATRSTRWSWPGPWTASRSARRRAARFRCRSGSMRWSMRASATCDRCCRTRRRDRGHLASQRDGRGRRGDRAGGRGGDGRRRRADRRSAGLGWCGRLTRCSARPPTTA